MSNDDITYGAIANISYSSEFDPTPFIYSSILKESFLRKLNVKKVWGSIRRRFAITYVVPKPRDSVSYLLIEGGI